MVLFYCSRNRSRIANKTFHGSFANKHIDLFSIYRVQEIFLLNSSLSGAALSNLKVTPDHGAMLRDIYPYIHAGWHMNKKHWISIYEDENVDSDLVIDLVHSSYELVVSKLNKLQRQRIAALKAIT